MKMEMGMVSRLQRTSGHRVARFMAPTNSVLIVAPRIRTGFQVPAFAGTAASSPE